LIVGEYVEEDVIMDAMETVGVAVKTDVKINVMVFVLAEGALTHAQGLALRTALAFVVVDVKEVVKINVTAAVLLLAL
jgi:hypothetical protein